MATYRNQFINEIKTTYNNAGMQKFLQSLAQVNAKIAEAQAKQLYSATTLAKDKANLEKLKVAMMNAYNSTTGVTNVNKFTKEINSQIGSYGKLSETLSRYGAAGTQVWGSMIKQVTSATQGITQISTMTQKFMTTFANTARWSIVTMGFQAILSSAFKAVNYMEELDSSLTNIMMVTDYSRENMQAFAKEAQKAAKALGATTTDYTNATLVFAQQGFDLKESQTYATLSTQLAKVSQQETSDTSDQITAYMNAYHLSDSITELKDALGAWAQVANDSAADVEELATASEKAASTAYTVGVSTDQLNATIATIESVTKDAPENIGNGLKTLYSRIADVKLGNTLDDGVGYGDFSSALKKAGVDILDSTGQMKDAGTIVEEIMERWQTLSQSEQTALATTVAGRYQLNRFESLMNNQDLYKEYLSSSENADYSNMEEMYSDYMGSIEAKTNQLISNIEGLFNQIYSSDIYSGLVDLLVEVSDILSNIFDSLEVDGIPILNQLNAVLPLLISLMSKLFVSIGAPAIVRKIQNTSMRKNVASNAKEFGILAASNMFSKNEIEGTSSNKAMNRAANSAVQNAAIIASQKMNGLISNEQAEKTLALSQKKTEAELRYIDAQEQSIKNAAQLLVFQSVANRELNVPYVEIESMNEELRELGIGTIEWEDATKREEQSLKTIQGLEEKIVEFKYFEQIKETDLVNALKGRKEQIETFIEGKKEYVNLQEKINKLIADGKVKESTTVKTLLKKNLITKEEFELMKNIGIEETSNIRNLNNQLHILYKTDVLLKHQEAYKKAISELNAGQLSEESKIFLKEQRLLNLFELIEKIQKNIQKIEAARLQLQTLLTQENMKFFLTEEQIKAIMANPEVLTPIIGEATEARIHLESLITMFNEMKKVGNFEELNFNSLEKSIKALEESCPSLADQLKKLMEEAKNIQHEGQATNNEVKNTENALQKLMTTISSILGIKNPTKSFLEGLSDACEDAAADESEAGYQTDLLRRQLTQLMEANSLTAKMALFGKAVSGVAMNFSSLIMTISSVRSMMDELNNSELTSEEKLEALGEGIFSLSFMIPMVISGFKEMTSALYANATAAKLAAVANAASAEYQNAGLVARLAAVKFTKLRTLATEEETIAIITNTEATGFAAIKEKLLNGTKLLSIKISRKLVAALGEEKAALLLANIEIAAIIALIALVAFGIYKLYKYFNEFNDALKEATTNLSNAKEDLKALSDACSDLKDKMESLQELEDGFDGLTRGTQEWKEQLQEVNAAILEIIDTYPELAKYVETDAATGALTLNENGVETYEQLQQDSLVSGYYKTALAEQEYGKAKNNLLLDDYYSRRMYEVSDDMLYYGAQSSDMTYLSEINTLENAFSRANLGGHSNYDNQQKILESLVGVDLNNKEAIENAIRSTGIQIDDKGIETLVNEFNRNSGIPDLLNALQQNTNAVTAAAQSYRLAAISADDTYEDVSSYGQEYLALLQGQYLLAGDVSGLSENSKDALIQMAIDQGNGKYQLNGNGELVEMKESDDDSGYSMDISEGTIITDENLDSLLRETMLTIDDVQEQWKREIKDFEEVISEFENVEGNNLDEYFGEEGEINTDKVKDKIEEIYGETFDPNNEEMVQVYTSVLQELQTYADENPINIPIGFEYDKEEYEQLLQDTGLDEGRSQDAYEATITRRYNIADTNELQDEINYRQTQIEAAEEDIEKLQEDVSRQTLEYGIGNNPLTGGDLLQQNRNQEAREAIANDESVSRQQLTELITTTPTGHDLTDANEALYTAEDRLDELNDSYEDLKIQQKIAEQELKIFSEATLRSQKGLDNLADSIEEYQDTINNLISGDLSLDDMSDLDKATLEGTLLSNVEDFLNLDSGTLNIDTYFGDSNEEVIETFGLLSDAATGAAEALDSLRSDAAEALIEQSDWSEEEKEYARRVNEEILRNEDNGGEEERQAVLDFLKRENYSQEAVQMASAWGYTVADKPVYVSQQGAEDIIVANSGLNEEAGREAVREEIENNEYAQEVINKDYANLAEMQQDLETYQIMQQTALLDASIGNQTIQLVDTIATASNNIVNALYHNRTLEDNQMDTAGISDEQQAKIDKANELGQTVEIIQGTISSYQDNPEDITSIGYTGATQLSGLGDDDNDKNDEEYDRYEQVNERLDLVSKLLENLNTQLEKFVGGHALEVLSDRLEALNYRLEQEHVKEAIQQDELNEIRTDFINDYGNLLDKDGTINQELYKEKFLSLSDDAQGDFQEAVEEYNEALSTEQEIQNTILEYQYEIIDAQLEQFDIQEDLAQSLNDIVDALRDVKNNYEYLLANQDGIESEFDSKVREWINTADSTMSILDESLRTIDVTTEDLKESRAASEVALMDEGGEKDAAIQALYESGNNFVAKDETTGEYYLDEASALSRYKDAISDVNKAIENVKSNLSDLQSGITSAIDEYGEQVENLLDAFDKVKDKLQAVDDMQKLVYGESSDAYTSAHIDNLNKEVSNMSDKLASVNSHIADLQENIANSTDPEEVKAWQEQLESLMDEQIATEKEILETTKQIYEAQRDADLTSWKNSLFGEDYDWLQEEWEMATDYAERYYDDIEKAYQIQKLQSEYMDTLDGVNELGIQQQITDLMNDQLSYLREKTNLSEYDVKYAEQQLEILQKQIALEEAQNNKSKLSLKRDSQGNYSYVYTADEEATLKAQEDLDDALYNAYELSKEQDINVQKEAFEAVENTVDKLKGLDLNDENYQEKANTYIDYLNKTLGALGTDMSTVLTNLGVDTTALGNSINSENSNSNLANVLLGLANGDSSALSLLDSRLKSNTTDALSDTTTVASGIESLRNALLDNQSEYQEKLDEYSQYIADAQTQNAYYQEKLSSTEEEVAKNLDTLNSTIATLNSMLNTLLSSAGYSTVLNTAANVSAYDTGGYTGTWTGGVGDKNGRYALLHQKELVLNANDTENLLDMVSIARDITNATKSSGLSQIVSGLGQVASTLVKNITDTSNQQITINADFPGVSTAEEIKRAFESLSTSAYQYAKKNY